MPQCRLTHRFIPVAAWIACAVTLESARACAADRVLGAGAFALDITPSRFPVKVNGGFLEASADHANDRLHARAIVLDDQSTRIAICVVDTCMMPRELIDQAKRLAQKSTRIPVERIVVSATHTHSAPSAMGCLGSAVDPEHAGALPAQISEAIVQASRRMVPVKAGWAVINAPEHTHCRRWIYRPDRGLLDPFGYRTVRANMHPGYQNPDAIGPSGPSDPELSMLSLVGLDDHPIALLANYSMHYFGAQALSADYYGIFARKIGELLGANPDFVGIMSQGTSGDQYRVDYDVPRREDSIEKYSAELASLALTAWKQIVHRPGVDLAMAESTLQLKRRVPGEERLFWARGLADSMAGRPPTSIPEVYALEQLHLHEEPERELKLQVLRIGDLGIALIPNEVFAITGLRIKSLSPLRPTFTIELANGSEGYIPPPEQHALGGYTTWPARTAALEVEAEPRIVDAVLSLLEQVAPGRARPNGAEPLGPDARAVLELQPAAYWRLEELTGSSLADATANKSVARLTTGFALGLPGPESSRFCGEGGINRSIHLAGGWIESEMGGHGDLTVSLWLWNGLQSNVRNVTGWILSRGDAGGVGEGVGLTGGETTKLFVVAGGLRAEGTKSLAMKSWHSIVYLRAQRKLSVYLDDGDAPEIQVELSPPTASPRLLFGASAIGQETLEGRLDEIAIFSRALSTVEIARVLRGPLRR